MGDNHKLMVVCSKDMKIHREEYVKVIIQALHSLGNHQTAEHLNTKCGFSYIYQPTTFEKFKTQFVNGFCEKCAETLCSNEGIDQNSVGETVFDHRLLMAVESAYSTPRYYCLSSHTEETGISYLYRNLSCDADQMPSKSLQVLTGHTDAAWYVQFSNNGQNLASMGELGACRKSLILNLNNDEIHIGFDQHVTICGHKLAASVAHSKDVCMEYEKARAVRWWF